jgi:hypothetical protein
MCFVHCLYITYITGPAIFDYNKGLIQLTVILLSGGHFIWKVCQNKNSAYLISYLEKKLFFRMSNAKKPKELDIFKYPNKETVIYSSDINSDTMYYCTLNYTSLYVVHLSEGSNVSILRQESLQKTDSFVLRRLNPAVLKLGVATLLRVDNFLKGLPYYETENFLVNFTK